MVVFTHGETVRVHAFSDAAEDGNGNAVRSWSQPGREVERCGFAPAGSTELSDGRVVQTPVLYAPKGTPVGPRDRVARRGVLYEVEGQPEDWVHPGTGWDPGLLVVRLKVVS